MKNRKKYSYFGVETKIILLIAFSIGEIFLINSEQDCAQKTTQHEYTFDTSKDFAKVCRVEIAKQQSRRFSPRSGPSSLSKHGHVTDGAACKQWVWPRGLPLLLSLYISLALILFLCFFLAHSWHAEQRKHSVAYSRSVRCQLRESSIRVIRDTAFLYLRFIFSKWYLCYCVHDII